METALTKEINAMLSFENVLRDSALSGKISIEGQLDSHFLLTALQHRLSDTKSPPNLHAIESVISKLAGFKVLPESHIIKNSLWSSFPFELKIKNCCFEDLFELEELIANSKFRNGVSEQEFIACEGALLLRLRPHDNIEATTQGLREFIGSIKTFAGREIETVNTNIKLYLLRRKTGCLKLGESPNTLLNDKRIRLSSFSEEENLKRSDVVKCFLEIKNFIGINQNLESLNDEDYPILNREGDFQLEELAINDKSHKTTSGNGSHATFKHGYANEGREYRKGSFRKGSLNDNQGIRKGSYNH